MTNQEKNMSPRTIDCLAHHDAEGIRAVVVADGSVWCAGGPHCRACWNFANSAETYSTYLR